MPNSFRGFDFEWEETLVRAVRLKVERTVQTWRSRPEQNVAADGPGTGAGETRRTKTTGKAERGRVKLNGNRRRIQKPNGSINETNRANELKTQDEPSERPQTSFLVLNIIVVMLNYEISSVESLPVWAFQPAFPIRRHRRLNPGLQVFFRASYTDLPAVNPPHRSSLKRTPQPFIVPA